MYRTYEWCRYNEGQKLKPLTDSYRLTKNQTFRAIHFTFILKILYYSHKNKSSIRSGRMIFACVSSREPLCKCRQHSLFPRQEKWKQIIILSRPCTCMSVYVIFSLPLKTWTSILCSVHRKEEGIQGAIVFYVGKTKTTR